MLEIALGFIMDIINLFKKLFAVFSGGNGGTDEGANDGANEGTEE